MQTLPLTCKSMKDLANKDYKTVGYGAQAISAGKHLNWQ